MTVVAEDGHDSVVESNGGPMMPEPQSTASVSGLFSLILCKCLKNIVIDLLFKIETDF